MFLRATGRKKEGKDNGCYSVMENQRVAGGKTVQRTVLYLDEINVLDRIEQLSGKAMRAWPGAFG